MKLMRAFIFLRKIGLRAICQKFCLHQLAVSITLQILLGWLLARRKKLQLINLQTIPSGMELIPAKSYFRQLKNFKNEFILWVLPAPERQLQPELPKVTVFKFQVVILKLTQPISKILKGLILKKGIIFLIWFRLAI